MIQFDHVVKQYSKSSVRAVDDLTLHIDKGSTLASIGPNGAERMRDIAQQLGVTLATLTVACDKLEQKGLVIRHRDRNDKRTVRVSLTEKGMVAYHFHCSFISALSDAMQEGMSPGEREALNRALEKLNLYFTEQE